MLYSCAKLARELRFSIIRKTDMSNNEADGTE